MSNPANEFVLHDKLAADTEWVTDLPLCRCLLMRDGRFPWLILVPRIADLREFHDVPNAQRAALMQEIEQASRALQQLTHAYKLNVAALGNQVPQLHIHVIARQTEDAAWPGPVWGVGNPEPYPPPALASFLAGLRQALTDAVSD
jgi:diadenosine tetraphosphate (Ap4A) HIT family hydrolase